MQDTEYTEIDPSTLPDPKSDDRPSLRGARSLPWRMVDLMRVTGGAGTVDLWCVYRVEGTGDAKTLSVKLPGGKSATLKDLRKAGLSVKVPTRLRTEHYA